MSDPFFGLNINNLQTINATNNPRLQDMNHSMTKPLMSSHLPQLPQQQMRTTSMLAPKLSLKTTKTETTTAEEELDERKKFEKYRKFQIQQKRLQEMSFSKTTVNTTDGNSSADKLMANLIQKVESEAKLDKRINSSNKSSGLHYYNQTSVPNNVSLISGPIQSPNTTATGYVNHFGQNMSATVGQSSVYMSGQQLPQNSSYFNSFYPSNPTTKTSIQQLTNTGVETFSYGPTTQTSNSSEPIVNYSFLPQMTTNTNINQMISTNVNLISNSDPIFSITTSNSINTGVANSITNPIPSTVRPPVVQKLPNCFEDVSKMPGLYLKVWNYVKINDINNVCDTNRLYPVLLSVGLPQTTLAKLWSVVNQTIPGQLTRHELNMALALIALIQINNTNPLDEIYRLDSLPMPTIKFFEQTNERTTSFPEVLQISTEIPSKPLILEPTFNENIGEQNVLNQNSYEFTQNISKSDQNFWPNIETKTISVDKPTEDDFDDFKSADFSSISSTVSQTVDNLIPKQSSSSSKIDVTLDNVTEEEFDDFKSVTFDKSDPKNDSTEPTKLENQINLKIHKLSDALMSNISAISSHINNLSPINQSLNSIPVMTISSVDSLESSPQTNSSPELRTAFNPNTNSVDKYSVFRELSADTSTKDDDFGNFLSHANNCEDSHSVDSLQFGHQDNNCDNNSDTIESIGQQIIQTSRQIIHKSFNVLLVNHGADSVLEAICGSDGNKFAFDLLEVYEIVKRVEKNLKINDKLNNYSIKLIEDIDNTWNSIRSLFTKASINVEIKTDDRSETDQNSSQCCICCSKATPMRPLLTFAGYDYHTSCANLWLNCINPTLPQPLINCH